MAQLSAHVLFVMNVRVLGGAVGVVIAGIGLGSCERVPLESVQRDDGGLLVVSFNVHYRSPRLGEMSWDRREAAVLDVLRDMDADLIGFQEMETFGGGRFNDENVQLESIRAAFPEYGVAATGDPRFYPSTQPIIPRRDLLITRAQTSPSRIAQKLRDEAP